MARKKPEESSGGNAPWLNTFADLMNLLLCFFVMLFAMSDVDAEKFDEISRSLANSIGILDGGLTAFEGGNLISSGMTQMNELDRYYQSMGRAGTDTGEDPDAEDSANPEGSKGDSQSSTGSGDAKLSEALERIEKEMESASSTIYDRLSDLRQEHNLTSDIDLSIDPEFRFVQLTLKGSVLFDSGKAEIKKAALPLMSRIGDMLQGFQMYTIEIMGHTDNVPMTSGAFQDNNWLSSARALNAAEYLIKNCGIDPVKLKYSGRGEYDPVASNATAEGRAKNRRIEIRIYNEYSGER